jgi:hypothetical protein
LLRFRSATLALPLDLTAILPGLLSWRYQEARRDNEERFARRAGERANAIASQLSDTIAATLLQADALHDIARLVTEARLSGDTAAEAALRSYLDPSSGHHPDSRAGALVARYVRLLTRPDGGGERVGVVTDATAEHAAAEARRAAEAELQRLNRALAAYSRSLFALIGSTSLEEAARRTSVRRKPDAARLSESRRRSDRAPPRGDADEAHGRRGDPSQAEHVEAVAIAIRDGSRSAILSPQDLSVSAARRESRETERGLGHRHHRIFRWRGALCILQPLSTGSRGACYSIGPFQGPML